MDDASLKLVSGLCFSSCHIVPPRKGSIHSVEGDGETAFDCAALIDPYYRHCEQDRNLTLAYRSPVVCLTCAGYLSLFADIDSETGTWRCPLCQSVNPCFYSSETVNSVSAVRSSYNELQSKHFDYHEELSGAVLHADQRFSSFNSRASTNSSSSGSGKRILLVLALDITLCSDEGVLSLLQESMGRSDMCDICIMVYGRHIHLLRLHGLSLGLACNPLQSDTLLGQTDQSPLFMHMIRRGEYCIGADKFSRSFSAMRDGLKALSRDSCCRGVTTGGVKNNRSGCTAKTLIALGLSMRQSKADSVHVKLVIVTGRSLSLALEQTTVGVSDYSRAGRVAHRGGCSVDVFFAGVRPGNFDQLDALAGASGGSLVVASAFSESSLRRSFASLMERFRVRDYSCPLQPSDLPCPLSMPTLEVRTCGALEVHRITGPVVPVREVLLYNSAMISKSISSDPICNEPSDDGSNHPLSTDAAELAVDMSHVSHSLLVSGGGRTEGVLSSKDGGTVYRRLVQHNSEHATICGIAAQQCSRADAANSNCSNSISVHFKRSDKWLSGTASSTACYVQFVVRFYVDQRSSSLDPHNSISSIGNIVKVTRVWTHRLPVTDDVEEYSHGLDAEVWGYAMGREVVADYHGQVLESFDGACAKDYSLEGD